MADPLGSGIWTLEGPSRPGVNRVVWDLQADKKHRLPTVDEEQLGQTQFVPAGEYRVALKMGEEKAEKTVKVLPAPNAPE